MPKAKKTDPKRVGSLLLQSLQESGIGEKHSEIDLPSTIRADTFAYWQTINDDDIEVVFLAAHWAGQLRCSVSLISLATHAAQIFRDDAKAVSALVDALKYLKTTMFLLLPITTQDMLVRAINLHPLLKSSKRKIEALRKLRELVQDPMISDFRKRITRTAKQLRAEKISSGGSETRLSKTERQILHTKYNAIYKIAKEIRTHHNTTLERFDQRHRRSGWNWEDWEEFWGRYAGDLYEHDAEFLLLFANQDRPSASEVAYRRLAAQTEHTRSYVERLVLKARKEAGIPKRRKKQTIKPSK
jgi:hypothetical protein